MAKRQSGAAITKLCVFGSIHSSGAEYGTVEGLFLLIMGIVLMVITWQSISKCWLPFGSNGLGGRLEISKDINPAGFWLAFCLYAIASIGITIYALLILAGICPPIPLSGPKRI